MYHSLINDVVIHCVHIHAVTDSQTILICLTDADAINRVSSFFEILKYSVALLTFKRIMWVYMAI